MIFLESNGVSTPKTVSLKVSNIKATFSLKAY